MCPNNSIEPNKKGFMKLDLYEKIIDEISDYAHDIYLFHRGESLMHPDFFEMVEYAQKKGLMTKLHTNATLLSEEKSYKLLKSELNFLSFSFDGVNKETYEKIRVGADFDETLDNIIRFLQLKKKYAKIKPYTRVQILDIPGVELDATEKKKFKERFRSLPLDEIHVIPAHNWAGNIKLNREHMRVSSEICTFPWYSLTVFWDGTVVPCPQDFMGELELGNAKTDCILNVWNSERMLNLRERMVEGKIMDLKPCNNCDRILRDTILDSNIPKQNLVSFISENVLGCRSKKFLEKILRLPPST